MSFRSLRDKNNVVILCKEKKGNMRMQNIGKDLKDPSCKKIGDIAHMLLHLSQPPDISHMTLVMVPALSSFPRSFIAPLVASLLVSFSIGNSMLGTCNGLNPTAVKSIVCMVFKWKRLERRVYNPLSFEPCATDFWGFLGYKKTMLVCAL